MTPAKISVIIATRNRAGLLPRAVDSVRMAGANVEIVVVDDASTDSTPEVCAGLSGVEVIRLRKKRGLAAARNAGLAKCRGALLAFLDDDDIRMPSSLDRQREFLQAHPEAAAAYGRVFLFDDSPEPQQRVARAGEIRRPVLGSSVPHFIPGGGIRRFASTRCGGRSFNPSPFAAEEGISGCESRRVPVWARRISWPAIAARPRKRSISSKPSVKTTSAGPGLPQTPAAACACAVRMALRPAYGCSE